MTNSKSTKRALVTSALAIFMCVAMLIGTTFAWFTDTASTAVNKIQSGTLDIQLVDKDGNDLEGTTLAWNTADNRAQEDILWEPGCTYTLNDIYVKNNGNLALKYKIEITGVDGDSKLLEAIEWTIGGVALDTELHLAAGATSEALTIKGHMKDDAGNEYQNLSIDGIAITVYATQDTVEYDSNNNTYDEKAQYATPVSTVDELAAAIANGEDVVLENSITLPKNTTFSVEKSVTIYGNGETKLEIINEDSNTDRVINIESPVDPGDLKDITLTLSGVDIVGPTGGGYNRGVSAWGIENLTIIMDNCTASANHYALNIASENTNVNVVVRNSTLTGYCAFQTWSAGTNATFENCTLVGNNQWSGDSDDFGAIVINAAATDSTLTFKNCRIEANELGTATEYFLDSRATGVSVTFDGCTFFKDGTEFTGDAIQSYMKCLSDTALTIK